MDMNMRHTLPLLAALTLLLAPAQRGWGQEAVDAFDYDISLDLSDGEPFTGTTLVTLRLLGEAQAVSLDLAYSPDSVFVDGQPAGTQLEAIPVAGHAAGDTVAIRVHYHGRGHVERQGWGGFHFEPNCYYNLGVAFAENPHVVGRSLFACRDNFDDKATYTLRVSAPQGWTALCGGERQQRTLDADGVEHSVWRIAQPTPTYLVSVSVAPWHRIDTTVGGLDGRSYPLTIGYLDEDSASVRQAFAQLDSVVPQYERCFGPYRWGRIGYIGTTQGSMEHVNNIALARDFMTGTAERGQTTMAHELGHAWFGNLVTCSTEADMWINEGGASFCSEVAMEATLGADNARNYYQRNLGNVVRTTHITDGSYLPLSPMPHHLTYGSTTYDKGALVWHSLRGHLGDSVFYAAMRRLMASCAFGNIDAAGLRDSLSAYTGTDLTDFFDFHVFGRGFESVHVQTVPNLCCADSTVLRVRRQGVGTNAIARTCRIPVTFYAADDDSQHKVWLTLRSADDTVSVRLPFAYAYYVLDADAEISDAATCFTRKFNRTDAMTMNNTYCRVEARHYDELPPTVSVEHHWGKPLDMEGTPGVVRTALRYWVVSGKLYLDENDVRASFQLVRSDNTTSGAARLDQGFYTQEAQYDSIRLMYRPMGGQWEPVARRATGNSREAFFEVTELLPGEYAFATVDTAVLGIGQAEHPLPGGAASLFPNPLPQGGELAVQAPLEGTFSLSVYDAAGRRVRHMANCRNGQKVRLGLPAGTYLVQIKNKCVSLQSNLIQL